MKLTAILVDGPWRYERVLELHSLHSSFENIFSDFGVTEESKLAWADSAYKDGEQMK